MPRVYFRNDDLQLTVDLDTDETAAEYVSWIDSQFERAGGVWLVANTDADGGNQSYIWFARTGYVVAHFDRTEAPESLRGLSTRGETISDRSD